MESFESLILFISIIVIGVFATKKIYDCIHKKALDIHFRRKYDIKKGELDDE